LFCAGCWFAQPGPIPPPKLVDPPPGRGRDCRPVNGQAGSGIAVYRGLMRLPPERREASRKDVLNYLNR